MDTFAILGWVKKALSVAVIGGVGWHYVHDLTETKADYAIVTAPLRTVSAPFDGELVETVAPSEVVEAGAKLVRIRRTAATNGEPPQAELQLTALEEPTLERALQDATLGSANTAPPVQQKQYEKARIVADADNTTELTTPHRLLIWSVDASRGTPIGQGQPVLQVAECSELFVFASVPAAKYARLSVGTEAVVTLKGEKLTGRVAQLLGPPESLASTRHLAPAPPQRRGTSTESGGVAITVPELAQRSSTSCQVGLALDVSFVTR